MLRPMNPIVITIKMSVSFQINSSPEFLSMMLRTITKNQRAGMMLLMSCNTYGMLEMGKMNPDSNTVGNKSPARDTIIAVC